MMRTFNYRPARYSIIRIEMAKQKALTGDSFSLPDISQNKLMDWTGDDEEALFNLIDQWQESTGHSGLNALIDDYPFSGGTPNSHHHMDEWEDDRPRKVMEFMGIDQPCEIQNKIIRHDHIAPGTIQYYTELDTRDKAQPW